MFRKRSLSKKNQYEVVKVDTGIPTGIDATATGMAYMPSIRGLGFLNQTNLLRKGFKIRGVISNAGQNDRLSFVSLSHQINDGRTTGYSEKEIIAGRYIPFKAGESVVVCVLTKLGKPNRTQGNTKKRRVTFVKKNTLQTAGTSGWDESRQ